jgi:hypothetical protein
MNTFLEFYIALLKFVNFKLFNDIGLKNYAELGKRESLDVKEVK